MRDKLYIHEQRPDVSGPYIPCEKDEVLKKGDFISLPSLLGTVEEF